MKTNGILWCDYEVRNKKNMNQQILNLAYHERRLIAIALKRTGGNVTKAYELNVPGGHYMTYKTYLYKINFVYRLKTNHPEKVVD